MWWPGGRICQAFCVLCKKLLMRVADLRIIGVTNSVFMCELLFCLVPGSKQISNQSFMVGLWALPFQKKHLSYLPFSAPLQICSTPLVSGCM